MVSLLLLARFAHAVCDDPMFAVIPAPAPDASRHGVATGTTTQGGKDFVGGRFSLASNQPPAVWADVLKHAENQDEWVPKRFGYDFVDWIDPTHMYLRFDIGFLMDSVHVKRQLVVQVDSGDAAGKFRTCWKMVDPTPWMSRIQSWVASDVDWERASAGWWEVTPQGAGSLVNYQWWSEVGRIPTSIQRYGMSNTLPDLLDAFEARVAAVK